MKAAQYATYGSSDVIAINTNAEKPSPKKGQVLVEVFAVGLNPVDWKVREGYMKDYVPLTFPVTIGGTFSGLVSALGEGVTEFSVGDEVYGQSIILNGGSGAIAEYTVSNVANTAHKPKTLTHREAAGLPLIGASAVQAIEGHINLQKGQKILIHGGAGGIGSVAIQLAKAKGAHVATTVRSGSKAYVQQFGPHEIHDEQDGAFEDKFSAFDAVFDTVGGDFIHKSFAIVKKGGIIVSMNGKPDELRAKELGVSAIGQNTHTSAENLSRVAKFVDDGIMQIQIDKVFPFDQTRDAFAYLENDRPRGKVIVEIKQ